MINNRKINDKFKGIIEDKRINIGNIFVKYLALNLLVP